MPAVVAVVVTKDPGPWFEQCLAGLAAQDYPELSVLVLAIGSDEGRPADTADDATARVARHPAGAFVRRLPDGGYGTVANQAMLDGGGRRPYLLCHDDVAPCPRRST